MMSKQFTGLLMTGLLVFGFGVASCAVYEDNDVKLYSLALDFPHYIGLRLKLKRGNTDTISSGIYSLKGLPSGLGFEVTSIERIGGQYRFKIGYKYFGSDEVTDEETVTTGHADVDLERKLLIYDGPLLRELPSFEPSIPSTITRELQFTDIVPVGTGPS